MVIVGNMLSASDKKLLLYVARDAVECYVKEQKTIDLTKLNIDEQSHVKANSGAFVTIYKRFANEKVLRGCLGHIWPHKPLIEVVCENAVAACYRDSRFLPVSLDELAAITVEINVLTQPRDISSLAEIVLGRDGIIFTKGQAQSVFLPIVPVEFGWDLHETINQLAIKAGLNAGVSIDDAQYKIFQTELLTEEQ